jgi:hypothetical protein
MSAILSKRIQAKKEKTPGASDDIANTHQKDQLTDTEPFIRIIQDSNIILRNTSPLVSIHFRANKCYDPLSLYSTAQTGVSSRSKNLHSLASWKHIPWMCNPSGSITYSSVV